MSKLKNYKNLTYTPSVVHPANIVGQFRTDFKKHKKNLKKHEQFGGAIIPALIAADALLKKLQLASRLKKTLEDNVKNKSNPIYKIAYGINSVGTSLRYGKKHHKRKK